LRTCSAFPQVPLMSVSLIVRGTKKAVYEIIGAVLIIVLPFIAANLIYLLIFLHGPMVSYDPLFSEDRSLTAAELISGGFA
jgi:hypothetical protein